MATMPRSPFVSRIPDPGLESLQQRFKQDPVLSVIQKNLSGALINASPEERKAYFDALLYSRQTKAALKQLFKPLQGLREFAEPLLVDALKSRFGAGLSVREDTFFYPRNTPSGGTGYPTRMTLLESALHNFERKEAVKGFFPSGTAICDKQGGTHHRQIPPEQFADLCRNLNLGLKYQDHLQDILEPDGLPGDAAREIFMANDRADMAVCAHVAAMRQTISKQACAALIELAAHRPDPQFDGHSIWIKRVTLYGHEIPRAMLIQPQRTWTFTQVPIVLYIPGDPVCPLKEFSSLGEVEDELRTRLMDKSYQAFFARLIGERKRVEFFTRLNRHLFALQPLDGNRFTRGLWQLQPDPEATLVLDTDLIQENPFSRMYRQQLFLLKDNARFLAVPTEDEDARSRDERLQYWFGIGMDILNLASFGVPPLAALMMVYTAVDLVGELYQGLEDLSHDELQEGLEHLTSVIGNIAFMALLSKAHGAGVPDEPPAITSNDFAGSLIPVRLESGEVRLWKPDLTPFRSRAVLPDGLVPQLDGVFRHEGKRYLMLEEQCYEVQHHKDLNKWVIKHPDQEHRFSPALEHNGVGAFRHEGERPENWAKTKLFQRLGHSVSGLSENCAERILNVVDMDESLLREVHVQNAVPPGQLRDTVKRFKLDSTLEGFVERPGSSRAERFDELYNASEVSSDHRVQTIRRDFPTLPVAVAEDLAATVTQAEAQQMLTTGRLPLRLNEAAVWQQREVRLNRALEGFELNSVSNPDTETLSLRLLEKLPGWSDQVRIEVRQGSRSGTLLESIGHPQAAEVKTLVKSNGRYQAFDAEGNELNGITRTGNNLCSSILHALPDGPRRALGFPGTGQGAGLNDALGKLAASDRDQVSRMLGIRKQTLKFNAPRRLKEGRLGYPLSGDGDLPDHFHDDHFLDRISLLGLERGTAQRMLAVMRSEGLSSGDMRARLDVLSDEHRVLNSSLEQWALASGEIPGGMSQARMDSRTRMGEAIRSHWQATALSTHVGTTAALRMEAVALADFPMQLPDFFYERIQQLELIESVDYIDPPSVSERLLFESMTPLERFLSRFPQVTSLEMNRPAVHGYRETAFPEVTIAVARHLPRLRALGLINQDLIATFAMLAPLDSLQQLERLDLSGNIIPPREFRSIVPD